MAASDTLASTAAWEIICWSYSGISSLRATRAAMSSAPVPRCREIVITGWRMELLPPLLLCCRAEKIPRRCKRQHASRKLGELPDCANGGERLRRVLGRIPLVDAGSDHTAAVD